MQKEKIIAHHLLVYLTIFRLIKKYIFWTLNPPKAFQT